MLELKGITKDYLVGDNKVQALKGIDITFRKSEFVSILGPSGCGKTTLLNIVGGLDKYTAGELFIDGISTKDYSDRDWDTYRNQKIGFVFQSYNLIPHQSISENVELALAISGIDKAERVRRAHEALDKVGLKDQYHKKPNQLSGGQCQRVAIARALVNNPEILLADEPTGALDTVTSVQIMDLIQEIAKECLVIMVTHNPELAEKYSTRIVKLLDGELVSDSAPFEIGNESNVSSTENNIVSDANKITIDNDTKEITESIAENAVMKENKNTKIKKKNKKEKKAK
ncbi:MAG: ABC transporter ATP-binding protein, partial [Clostridia bacterium]|nr:ABC transporter ATP-binding protein [Clostridia bacterium]